MNPFRDRFEAHPVHETLRRFNEVKSSWDIPEERNGERAHLDRFYRVFSKIEFLIKNGEPDLWSAQALDSANSAVERLIAVLEEFKSIYDVKKLSDEADTALAVFQKNSWIANYHDSGELASAFTAFIDHAKAQIKLLENHSKMISSSKEEIDQAKLDFLAEVEEFRSQLDSHQAVFEAQKTRVDELVTSQQQTFQTAQVEREKSFQTEIRDRETKSEDWFETAESRLDSSLTALKNKADAHLAEMEQHKARAKEILGIVAASGVSGHYKKTATREWISAEILRILALASFGLMGFLIYHVVESLKQPEFRWEMGLFRVGVGLALLVPAYYCARESARHREAEKRNRRLQIELATIEPYLEKLNDDPSMRQILKEKANSYFMGQLQNEPVDDANSKSDSQTLKRREDQLFELLKAALSGLKR